MADITLTVGDRLPVLGRQFLLDDAAVNLTGYTVTFDMWDAATGAQVITGGAASIVSASTGEVSYAWAAADVDTAGRFFGRFKAETGGVHLSAPNSGFIVIEIGARATGSNGSSYTGNPADRLIDQVRFLIQDTDVSDPAMSDAEIEWVLSQWADDAYAAAIAACEIKAAESVQRGITSKSVGGLSISYDTAADRNWRSLADSLRRQRALAGAIRPRLASTNDDIAAKQFAIGQNDFEGTSGTPPWDETSGW